MRKTTAFFAIIVLLMCFAPVLQAQEEALLPPDGAILADMYSRINAFRERRGLTPYRLNDALNHAAQEQAEFLVRTAYRSHFRPDGSRPSTRAAAYGFVTSHWCCGENYYMSIDATPDLVFDFWRWSPNHRVNLAHRDFTDIGLGMSSDGYRISYVTIFGEADDLHPPVPTEVPNVAVEQPAAPAEVTADSVNTASAAPAGDYVVVDGDTLGIIATRYHTTVQVLMTANHLANPEIIYVGQHLLLPGAAPGEAAVEPPAESNPEVAAAANAPSAQQHVVEEGETLAQIAARYGTTIQAITAANNINDPSLIYAGQVLNIPPAS
jgi:LysM repeat protein